LCNANMALDADEDARERAFGGQVVHGSRDVGGSGGA
jgi:hypothetical protein